ncbi:arsenate reductase [Rhodobium orientis]|uniref:Arsenate reductase n=1 Tax=Rhodobium orientis TaxID=34017 RepID=A0A327JNS2_9HYPH|nr:arsenate reductase (glutaredoxin) [Rhodobium orientis]MBB4304877.1 arsenate reductase [Rhodobium orientis]MBK5949206.1 arsenate reductase (glutaredoxin) [Rhodobium orientis]RAI27375.1 arsenate reductase (glutaredoxin) [Rhodobium orientis]
MTVTIWHNPRCSKSRQALQLLRDNGVEPEIVEYLKTPPSEAEIRAVLDKLGIEPRALMRTKEKTYKELGLAGVTDNDKLVAAMAENPVLIERPVVLKGGKAALGRPPEDVLKVL